MPLSVPPSPPSNGPPSSVSAPQLFCISHAWLTPSPFSSTTPRPPSPTSPLPTHSPPPTPPKAGIPASPPQPARHFPVSRAMDPAFMSPPWMAPHSPSSGGVSGPSKSSLVRRLHLLIESRKWHPAVRLRRGVRNLRPSARRPHKLLHRTSPRGEHIIGGV